MLRARDAMDRTYAEPLNIPALAQIALVSEAHFIRTFRATFGETPHRYLQRRRVERSMFLLRETDRSITDVCMDVGFNSLGTFSRTFREIMGESPSDYRKRSRSEAGPRGPGATGSIVQALLGGAPGTPAQQVPRTGPIGVPTCFSMAWTRPSSSDSSGSSSSFGEADDPAAD
jgi:AraC-like DNA-binding protein